MHKHTDQITCWLASLTPHTAALSTMWLPLGSAWNGQDTLHLLQKYLQPGSDKLNLVGWQSGKINKQMGGTGYEVCTRFMALDASEKYHSQIYWPLEQLELAQSIQSKWQMFLHTQQSPSHTPSHDEYLPHATHDPWKHLPSSIYHNYSVLCLQSLWMVLKHKENAWWHTASPLGSVHLYPAQSTSSQYGHYHTVQ